MNTKSIIFYLKTCCFMVFIGRAYQHLFWDAPFRSLLWDQDLLAPIVMRFLNMNWQDYVTDLRIDNTIQCLIKFNGLLYALCAIIALIVNSDSKKWMRSVLFLGGCSLVILSLLITKEKFYHTAMFFEHTIQFGTPFLLYFFLKNKAMIWLLPKLKIIIALSFTCHGLYAIGILYPLPENFVTMTLNILPLNEATAKEFLFLIGIIDFIIAIFIYVPKLSKITLIYASLWGIITALARIISGVKYGFSLEVFHQYFYLTLYRIPHGLIPLLACYIINNINERLNGVKFSAVQKIN